MKKLWISAILGFACICAASGQTTVANLDAAIQRASMSIFANISTGPRIALLTFTSPSKDLSYYVLDELTQALGKNATLRIAERSDVDSLLTEMNLEVNSDISDSDAQEIGRRLRVETVVTGSLVKMAENYSFRNKVMAVSNTRQQKSMSVNVRDNPHLQQLLGQDAASNTADTVISAPPAPSGYNIGDTGPAGGLIFYDKGDNSDGWRYLEAAPVEAEFQAVWSLRTTAVDNTQDALGGGKRNTGLIVEKFNQVSGEANTAAQQSDNLEFNGFDDWFLPSTAELEQMYGNLKRRNLGSFKNGRYWSSVQYSDYNANIQNFQDGRTDSGSKGSRYYVRPIRQVEGQN